jgi:2-polyprenyl-3-methyl-5-hydroxy-6-metoxy-1,4-benzoquinol methylase
MSDANKLAQLRHSWNENASAWRDAVRERKIASRRAATDAAVIEAVMALHPASALDLGCGEGWLARELASRGVTVCGVDGSRPLIDAANDLGGASFHALSYDQLADAGELLGAPFEVVVANFAILEEEIQPLLRGAATLLRDGGALVIQTVHPAFATGAEPYVSGWRTETFAAIEGEWREPMPWYFRTIGSWTRELAASGWLIAELHEPLDADGMRPLSMILVCRRIG